MRLFGDRPGLRLWLGLVTTLSAFVSLSVGGPAFGPVWESPGGLVLLVVVGASLCLLGSAGVVVVGWHGRTAEVAILGGALVALSALALVHGLTVPGVLFGANPAVTTASLLALPAALCIAAPLLAARTGWARSVARRWRAWVLFWTAAVAARSRPSS